MSVRDPAAALPEPPSAVTDQDAQDRRLIQMMLQMTPAERLETLRRWAALVPSEASKGS